MKQIIYTLSSLFLTIICVCGQILPDSNYTSLWENKNSSIFQTVESGTFTGTTTGYVQVKNDKDTLVLDFQTSKTTLNVIHDPDEMYYKSTKKYVTQTTSGKTSLTYESYALANICP